MMMQLLQAGFNPPPPGQNPMNNAAAAGGIAGIIGLAVCFVFIVLVLTYGPFILMLVRSMQALGETRERNRTMAPGLVWLALIPCFSVIWTFVVVIRASDALQNEFDDRRMRSKGDHGRQLGMTYAVLSVVSIALNSVSRVLDRMGNNGNNVAMVAIGIGCVGLILFIVQIVVAFLYAGKLKESTQRLRRDSDKYDDDEDEDFEEVDEPKPRPKPKKKPADDEFEEYDDNPKGGR